MNKAKPDRPLSILHIILALRPTNGQYNEHCLPLMDERDITVCTYFKSEIRPPARITLFDGDNTVPGFHRALRAALKAREYDIIHVHTPHAGVLLLMTLLLSGWYRKLKPLTVHTVQNSFQNFKLRNKLLFIPSFAYSQRLVFCSHASYESFPAYMKWLGGDRMNVIQNAFDPDRIDSQLNGAQIAHHNRFTVVTVGLIEMKNPFTVLAAFRQANDEASDLIYLGEGDLRPSLSQEIKNSGLEKAVKLTGMIARDSVFEHFAAADLFVSASWGEGLPVAVLEAMACRCPVLLSDIPPHREITHGIDFIPLIKPDDVAGFAREIKRFREMPVSERVAIGQKCRKLVEERFSLSTMHAGYAEVYTQVTGQQFPELLEKIR
ncbi:MAG TPA: glycosyltransferase family 4 protein [Anaerolineales bacterium]|nr:glycosyltransferase family 4 protein [Anaerolineales bacterium]